MKSVVQFVQMTANQAATTLKSLCTRHATGKKEIVKLLVAREEAGDFGKGEMNTYAQRVTGMELRREIQGTYEAVNVMKGIRSGELPMTEEEFDSKKFGSFPLIMLSGFMSKSPEKVIPALEIIRSGEDVTKRLKELRTPPKPKAEKESKESKESAEAETGESEIQTPEAPKGDSYFVPEGTGILAVEAVQKRILEDMRNAPDVASCENYHEFLKGLVAHLHTRWEVLEAEAQTPAKELQAA